MGLVRTTAPLGALRRYVASRSLKWSSPGRRRSTTDLLSGNAEMEIRQICGSADRVLCELPLLS
jgi:hypothetical protein